jgi:SAM-dependent methyltransferase
MNIQDQWRAVIAEGHTLRLVEEGIYSVLPEDPPVHLYDRRAAMYDLVVGSRLYNRVMWGALLRDYVTFARQAVESNSGGMMLDAGCGSLLFTAQAYLECSRPIIAFDQSLHMLRRARSRLKKLAGSVPERILLLQADISDPPLRPASFPRSLHERAASPRGCGGFYYRSEGVAGGWRSLVFNESGEEQPPNRRSLP